MGLGEVDNREQAQNRTERIGGLAGAVGRGGKGAEGRTGLRSLREGATTAGMRPACCPSPVKQHADQQSGNNMWKGYERGPRRRVAAWGPPCLKGVYLS